ncbi:MAG: GNAT family N-acetyltransferase [Proteobacteria bacterium]|nr:GNAT family N-acetyltransferase [Pseudomonadota bacterium]
MKGRDPAVDETGVDGPAVDGTAAHGTVVEGTAVDGTAVHRPFVIRLAALTDADRIVTVLRRSITELCVADHHNDPGVLGAWLENKTVANVRAWIESPRTYMVVADRGTNTPDTDPMSTKSVDAPDPVRAAAVCGVASMSTTGAILLCYLLPEVQFTGVGRALLNALETEARRRGLREVSLESTVSARGFYSRYGYRPSSNDPANSSLLFKVLTP